jgi:hypothetical protein
VAVAFGHGSTGHGASPSWAHDCTGDTILLVFGSDWEGADNENTSAITFNGVSLALVSGHAYNTGRVSGWVLLNPASGSHNIVVTNSSTQSYVAVSLSGSATDTLAHALSALSAATGGSNTPTSASLTVAATDVMVDAIGILTGSGATVGSGFTQIGTVNDGNTKCQAAYKAGAGGSLSDGWTGYTQDTRWSDVAVVVQAPVAAGSLPTGSLALLGVGR